MPPKRKRPAATTTVPSKRRSQRSNRLVSDEQDADNESELVASDAGPWPPPSSYSGVSKLHFDDISQYSDVAPSFPQFPRRSSRFKYARGPALVILDAVINKSTHLPQPLSAARDALQAVIQIVTENINVENQGWAALTTTLKLHLSTVQDQLVKLAVDEGIDKSPLSFNPTIKEPLRSYASTLKEIYDLVGNKKIYPRRDTDVIRHNLDEEFHQYSRGLHRFVASTVDQLRKNLLQVDHAVPQKALTTYSSRTEDINAYGAQHSQCHPGTRIKTLDTIRKWANSDDPTEWMFCLLDFAGSGKSTISKHMDKEFKGLKLTGRFFFSRDTAETMSIKWFCSIVANAFASRDETFKTIMNVFKKRQDYELLSFEEQFEGLIVAPLKTLSRPAILIIDALDECDNEHGHRSKLLNTIANQLPRVPHLRVFATGRPERDIKEWATTTSGVRRANFLELEGNQDDVGRYIRQRLSHLPPNLQAQVSQVVENAEGVFIWARIACDLLCKTVNVQDVLKSLETDVTLEYLYTVALEQSVPKESHSRRAVLMVLEVILALQSPRSIAELSRLLPNPDAVEAVASTLGSILLYKDRNDPIRLIHATLREFLTSATKAGPWLVRLGLGHHILASSCINLLAHATEEERSSSSYIRDDAVCSVIQYSWDAWVYHCENSNCKLGLNEVVIDFIDNGYEYFLDDSLRANQKEFGDKVVALCRLNMSPFITQTLISRSFQWVCSCTFRLCSD